MNNRFKSIPKIDLHCHLDGSIPHYVLQQLALESGLQVPQDMDMFTQLVSVKGISGSLVEYLKKFDIPVSSLQSGLHLEKAAYSLIEDVKKENTVYIEVRFAPLLHTTKGLEPYQVVQSVLNGLEKGREDFGVDYGLILCAMRHTPQEENMPLIDLAQEFIGRGVVALDLAGDEKNFPVGQHTEFFSTAKAKGVPFTIHAGEADGASSVWGAVNLGAKRIGHGIAIQQDSELVKYCKENKIGIEMCPVSNLQTGIITDWQYYPFQLFLDNDILLTINTDNRTVSLTNTTNELETLAQHFDISDDTLRTLYMNGVEISFATDKVKEKLKSKWRN